MLRLLLFSVVVSLVTSVCAVLVLRMTHTRLGFHFGRYLLPLSVISGWLLSLLGAA
jgi:hypothetical protein